MLFNYFLRNLSVRVAHDVETSRKIARDLLTAYCLFAVFLLQVAGVDAASRFYHLGAGTGAVVFGSALCWLGWLHCPGAQPEQVGAYH